MKPQVQEFIEKCEQALLDATEVPEAGEEFAASVSDKIERMKKWAEERNHVTEKQQEALENMCGGIARWLERGER